MKHVRYPFWIVTQQRDNGSQPLVIPECPDHVLAFTSVQKAKDYMRVNGADSWELLMVSRSTLRPLLERYRQRGLLGLCFDPEENSSGQKAEFELLH